jgi:peptidyl-dipeptidase A
MKSLFTGLACGIVLLVLPACQTGPTPDQARAFVDQAEKQLLELTTETSQAQWVQSTYITDDTEALAADANEKLISVAAKLAKEAATYDIPNLPPDVARKIMLLKNGLTMAAPADPAESRELAQIAARMEGDYGKGKYCPGGTTDESKCLDVNQITEIMDNSRDPKQLQDVWTGWRTISPPMRADYKRFVELSNKGARELGFADTGAMWRSKYDMPPDQFAKELDRLWEQVRPLYLSLHTYVRGKLREKYGASVVPEDGPIPADLLGNIWAQEWEHIYPVVAPKDADPGYDLTKILVERKTTPIQMVHYGEGFFESLGFAPLPPSFWQRSMFVKPADRDVVCHASAWDVDSVDDLRLKMCIQINDEDFTTIHHELGHNFYQRAYNQQPFLFRDSANDGFHEAIGDTIALSVTPEYLVKLGLLKQAPPESKDIGLLLNRALEKVAFLPFGLLIDQWRWKVFSGEITPDKYNQAWWELRTKYQGIAPPVARSEKDFDPGAKYHVPANVPYMRYFLADILQFQFHRALAKAAGCTEPLHRCSIYGNQAAGEKLKKMLEMGASKPWPDALEELTGQREMDATAMLEYFAPLKKWLDEQNKGMKEGW